MAKSAVPAVILGGSYNALSVARSLGSRGIAVHVLGDGVGGSVARHSRFVSSYVEVPDPDSCWGVWMHWIAAGTGPAVVLAGSDSGLEFIAKHREAMSDLGYCPVEADDGVTLSMLDKARTYELARAVGVDTPRTATVSAPWEVRAVADDFGYPCALKPRDSFRFARMFGTKGVVVETSAELVDAFEAIVPSGLEMLVTELVPGTDDEYCSYYSYLDDGGEALFHFTKRKLRQCPPGFGIGTYHVSAWEPEAAELGLRFFQGVKLRGIGNVEFNRDCRDGRLKLIECNPRLTAADGLVRRAGVDIAWLAYRRSLGEPVGVISGFRPRVRQWHPTEDWQALTAYRKTGRMGMRSWLASLAHVQHLPAWDWRDPRPSLAYDVAFARRAIGWAGRRAVGTAGHHRERPTFSSSQRAA